MKKSNLCVSMVIALCLGGWCLNVAQAVLVVGGGAVNDQHDHGAGYNIAEIHYWDGQSGEWSELGGASYFKLQGCSHVYALCEYEGFLYAATDDSKVFKWTGFTNGWVLTGINGSIEGQNEVRSLIVYNNHLYAGVCPTSNGDFIANPLYVYDPELELWSEVNGQTCFGAATISEGTSLSETLDPDANLMRHGIASMYVWNGDLYLGDLFQDCVVRWNSSDMNYPFQEEMARYGCCIWDFAAYQFGGDIGERLYCISQGEGSPSLPRIYARPFAFDASDDNYEEDLLCTQYYGCTDKDGDGITDTDAPWWFSAKESDMGGDDPVYFLEVCNGDLYGSSCRKVGPLSFDSTDDDNDGDLDTIGLSWSSTKRTPDYSEISAMLGVGSQLYLGTTSGRIYNYSSLTQKGKTLNSRVWSLVDIDEEVLDPPSLLALELDGCTYVEGYDSNGSSEETMIFSFTLSGEIPSAPSSGWQIVYEMPDGFEYIEGSLTGSTPSISDNIVTWGMDGYVGSEFSFEITLQVTVNSDNRSDSSYLSFPCVLQSGSVVYSSIDYTVNGG